MTNAILVQALECRYGKELMKIGTDLIMAAEKAGNSVGKKTLFGSDKWAPAHDKFLQQFAALGIGLIIKGVVKSLDDRVSVIKASDEFMIQISTVYPNWPTAHRYWQIFVAEMRSKFPSSVDKSHTPEKKMDSNYWKSRAKSMTGKLKAEVPRFTEETRAARERINKLE
jgi:hypothetical protein